MFPSERNLSGLITLSHESPVLLWSCIKQAYHSWSLCIFWTICVVLVCDECEGRNSAKLKKIEERWKCHVHCKKNYSQSLYDYSETLCVCERTWSRCAHKLYCSWVFHCWEVILALPYQRKPTELFQLKRAELIRITKKQNKKTLLFLYDDLSQSVTVFITQAQDENLGFQLQRHFDSPFSEGFRWIKLIIYMLL